MPSQHAFHVVILGQSHIPIVKASSLNCSPKNDDEVCQDDGSFAPNLLSKDERYNGTNSASYIVDGRNKASHGCIRVTERVLEALPPKDTAEETLVILILR